LLCDRADKQARQFELKTSTFTFAAFVGAFTILVEDVFIVLRIVSPNSLVVSLGAEATLGFVQWVFWLAAAIATTHFTSDGRSVCKHLNELFELPEFEGMDREAIKIVKKALKSACSEMHAELAFMWIGFILTTLVVASSVFLWMKNGRTKEVGQGLFSVYQLVPCSATKR